MDGLRHSIFNISAPDHTSLREFRTPFLTFIRRDEECVCTSQALAPSGAA
jgi:hypothetical protein